MLVREIMSPNVTWISPSLSIQETAQTMRKLSVDCLPVRENDRHVGLITEHDITFGAVARGANPAGTAVRDVMSTEPAYCFEDQDVAEASHIMEHRHLWGMPVFNHQDHLVGVLSLGKMAVAPRTRRRPAGRRSAAGFEPAETWIAQCLDLCCGGSVETSAPADDRSGPWVVQYLELYGRKD